MSERMSAKTRELVESLATHLEIQLRKGREHRDELIKDLRKQSRDIADNETSLTEVRSVLGVQPPEDAEPEGSNRDQWIAGMRALCDFFEQNPDVPVPPSEYVQFNPRGETNAELLAAVEAAAAAMGVKAYHGASSKFANAHKYFGPVTYSVSVHLKDEPEPDPAPVDEHGECMDERMVAETDAPEAVSA